MIIFSASMKLSDPFVDNGGMYYQTITIATFEGEVEQLFTRILCSIATSSRPVLSDGQDARKNLVQKQHQGLVPDALCDV